MTGFAKYILPAHYLLSLGLLLEIFNGVSIIQLYAYRFWAVVKLSPSARTYNYFLKFLVFIGYFLGVILFLLLEYVAYKNPNATQQFIAVSKRCRHRPIEWEIIYCMTRNAQFYYKGRLGRPATKWKLFQNYSCIKELTDFPIELYGYDQDIILPYFGTPLALATLAVFSIYMYFIFINLRAINVRSVSPQLRKLHQSYIIQLIYQTLLPIVILMFPVVFLLVVLYNEIWGHACKDALLYWKWVNFSSCQHGNSVLFYLQYYWLVRFDSYEQAVPHLDFSEATCLHKES